MYVRKHPFCHFSQDADFGVHPGDFLHPHVNGPDDPNDCRSPVHGICHELLRATGTLGVAFAATGAAFPFFSPFLGWLGVFLTGSDTSSNALFESLQSITAERLGFNQILNSRFAGYNGKRLSARRTAGSQTHAPGWLLSE